MVNIVTIEGHDYSGKSTTIGYLAKQHEDNKKLSFNEGSVYPTSLTARLLAIANQANDIEREYVYTTIYMMDKPESVLRHPDDDGTVLQDRYWPSVLAYGRYLNGENSIHNVTDYSQDFLQPHSAIVLSCSYDEIIKRSDKRGRKSVIDGVLLSDEREVQRLLFEIEKSLENIPEIYRIDTTDKSVRDVASEITEYLKEMSLL